MLICDQFILVHFPKTGGTFVTKVLQELFEQDGRLYERLILNDKNPYTDEVYGQHGGCNEIPDKWRNNRFILSIIRNPFELYVSQYEFKWWRKKSPEQSALIKAQFPNYPDLSFKEYLQMKDRILKKIKFGHTDYNDQLGDNSLMFLRFYFKNPYALMNQIDKNYITEKRYRRDMYPLFFLHTEQLNRGLYQFLLSQRFEEQRIRHILDMGKINPVEGGRSANQNWQKYYTAETRQWVREKERLLFDIFPEYDC